MDLYDEFGNYIGPDVDSDADSHGDDGEEDDAWMDRAEAAADARMNATSGGDFDGAAEEEDEDMEDANRGAITLAEDKKYYPSAEEVYGEGTETLVENEDAQPLEK